MADGVVDSGRPMRRLEASFDVPQLTASQQQCRHRILTEIATRGRLVGQAQSAGASASREAVDRLGLPVLDQRRYSNCVFVDAARGAGKTTLLLSVLNECNRVVLDQQINPTRSGSAPIDWLWTIPVSADVIDFVRIGDDTPVLMLFAQAFERLIHRLCDTPSTIDTYAAGGTTPQDQLLDAWEELKRAALGRTKLPLKESIAESAYQVGELARSLLSLDETVEEFVRRFEEVWTRSRRRQARDDRSRVVLVIPIDDADAHASRSQELIQLLRAIHHPQLLFVLVGDSQIIRHVLFDGFLRDFTRRVQYRGIASEWAQHGAALAERLAADVFARVLPPPARVTLTPLSFEEALNKKLSLPEVNGIIDRSLREVLVAAFYGAPAHSGPIATWRTILGIDDAPESVTPTEAAALAGFRALFPTRLRDLVDFTVTVRDALDAARQRYQGRYGEEALSDFASMLLAHLLFDDAVRQTLTLSDERYRTRVSFVAATGLGGPSIDNRALLVDTKGLTVHCAPMPLRTETTEQETEGVLTVRQFSYVGMGDVVVANRRAVEGRAETEWKARVSSAFLFACQIMADRNEGDPGFLPEDWSPVRVTVRVGRERVLLEMPLPQWPDWASYARFDRRCTDAIRTLSRSAAPDEVVAVAVACAMIQTVAADDIPLQESIDALVREPDRARRLKLWSALADRLRGWKPEAQQSNLAKMAMSRLDSWRAQVAGVVFSPEFGLPVVAGSDEHALWILLKNVERDKVISARAALRSKISAKHGSADPSATAGVVRSWLARLARARSPSWDFWERVRPETWDAVLDRLRDVPLTNAPFSFYTLRRFLDRPLVRREVSRTPDAGWFAFFGDIDSDQEFINACISRAADDPQLQFESDGRITAQIMIAFSIRYQKRIQFGERVVYACGGDLLEDGEGDQRLARWLLADLAADEIDPTLRLRRSFGAGFTAWRSGDELLCFAGLRFYPADDEQSVNRLTVSAFVPAFDALADYEVILQSWNEIATSLVRPEHPIDDRRAAADNAVASLLRATFAAYLSRETSKSGVVRQDRERTVEELYAVQLLGDRRRDRVFDAWRRSVVLFAAPEFGLTHGLCAALIAGHVRTFCDGVITPNELARLDALRTDLVWHARSDGAASPRVDGGPAHPWDAMFSAPAVVVAEADSLTTRRTKEESPSKTIVRKRKK